MAKATDEEKAELREMLPALEEEAEDAATAHRDSLTDDSKARHRDAADRLRYVRWRLRGGDPETAERGAPHNPFEDGE